MIELIDIPQYYACRLSKLGPMPFPNEIDAFFKQLYPLLIVTWQMKASVKATSSARAVAIRNARVLRSFEKHYSRCKGVIILQMTESHLGRQNCFCTDFG